jgi:hypothetical protein
MGEKLWRFPVPGGWIYKVYYPDTMGERGKSVAMCYVPDPTRAVTMPASMPIPKVDRTSPPAACWSGVPGEDPEYDPDSEVRGG